ncbi:hypothetical protein CPB86DRAFT_774061 [Serendipita vermifera]|nr:hypothetical protein CPB86DRAFT_774061 [Serendipita vermifera]
MVLEAPLLPPEPAPAPGALEHFNTACLSAADVQNFVKRLVDGQPLAGMDDEEADEDPERFHQHLDDQDITTNKNAAEPDVEEDLLRGYKINKPPTMRPVRVYIAGLFDVLHPGIVHNLRQAKYSFPSVHLLVGVFAEPPPHSPSIFTHLERLETVRHIRYIDELIPEAPLHLTQSFLREWNIDYVAYEGGSNTGDADETAANWNDPGFQLARKLGKFLPLRSTRAISTGEVLQRIRAEGTYGGLAREATVTDKPHPLSITTDFAPLTPASYQDDDDDDEGKKTKEVTPEPNELLDPFTN